MFFFLSLEVYRSSTAREPFKMYEKVGWSSDRPISGWCQELTKKVVLDEGPGLEILKSTMLPVIFRGLKLLRYLTQTYHELYSLLGCKWNADRKGVSRWQHVFCMSFWSPENAHMHPEMQEESINTVIWSWKEPTEVEHPCTRQRSQSNLSCRKSALFDHFSLWNNAKTEKMQRFKMGSPRLRHLDLTPKRKKIRRFSLVHWFHDASSLLYTMWIYKIVKSEETGAKNFWGPFFWTTLYHVADNLTCSQMTREVLRTLFTTLQGVIDPITDLFAP